MEQLSLEDCFITLNRLRAQHGLVELYACNGNVIVPPSEIEAEREQCRYWQYYNASCKVGIAPKCIAEWRKEQMKER